MALQLKVGERVCYIRLLLYFVLLVYKCATGLSRVVSSGNGNAIVRPGRYVQAWSAGAKIEPANIKPLRLQLREL